MYTGMLTAFLGLVLAVGIVAALAALVILILSIGMKIAAEEELLREEFGEEYEQYLRDVKAIIPFIL
jgi:protein-S-isoprenylcysteine O-methyltransferase Ste14